MPDPPSNVHLSVASSSSVQVTFWEPLSVNSAVVTKYKGKDRGPCAVAEHPGRASRMQWGTCPVPTLPAPWGLQGCRALAELWHGAVTLRHGRATSQMVPSPI